MALVNSLARILYRRILCNKVIFVLGLVLVLYVFTQNMYTASTGKRKEEQISNTLDKKETKDNNIQEILNFESENILNLENYNKTGTYQACVVPSLNLNDPVMLQFIKKPPKITCGKGSLDFLNIKIHNSTLHYENFSKYSCDFTPILKSISDERILWGGKIRDISPGFRITSDFFKLDCYDRTQPKIVYSDVFINAVPKTNLDSRSEEVDNDYSGLQKFSVLMLGFDSMSRMNWMRTLPKTRDFFIKSLGGIELQGYNIMGDGTPAALFPMLTGHHEEELPEARRNFRGAKHIDGFPWIWKEFEKSGYITSYADAEVHIAPFNMRLLGFKAQPTDYYMRPYFMAVAEAEKAKKSAAHCRGSKAKHRVWLDWPKNIIETHRDKPMFLMHFYATLSHDDVGLISLADDDIKDFLEDLKLKGHLNKMIVVLFGDHGARNMDFRATWSGKLEERLPYMAFYFPHSFKLKYPTLMKNFLENRNKLSSPLDIHKTLQDLVNFSGAGNGDVKNRAISLFKAIPLERTCKHANISNHWCSCLTWKELSVTDERSKQAANEVVRFINALTLKYRADCHELKIESVISCNMLSIHEDMIKFRKSKDIHGREPVFDTKTLKHMIRQYQVTLKTSPGNGMFEVTLTHDMDSNSMLINEKEISRINKYGNDSLCIFSKNRQLRQYCYCTNNIR